MVSEPRKQSLAWMETDYSKHTHFRWSGAFGRARSYGRDNPPSERHVCYVRRGVTAGELFPPQKKPTRYASTCGIRPHALTAQTPTLTTSSILRKEYLKAESLSSCSSEATTLKTRASQDNCENSDKKEQGK